MIPVSSGINTDLTTSPEIASTTPWDIKLLSSTSIGVSLPSPCSLQVKLPHHCRQDLYTFIFHRLLSPCKLVVYFQSCLSSDPLFLLPIYQYYSIHSRPSRTLLTCYPRPARRKHARSEDPLSCQLFIVQFP